VKYPELFGVREIDGFCGPRLWVSPVPWKILDAGRFFLSRDNKIRFKRALYISHETTTQPTLILNYSHNPQITYRGNRLHRSVLINLVGPITTALCRR
jgi:hypothetical protein